MNDDMRDDKKDDKKDDMKKDNGYIGMSLPMLMVGLVLIVAGIIAGEHQVVFEKAIRICMECVGIG